MSKLVVIFESNELTQQQYDSVLLEMNEKEKMADVNRPVHIAFQKGDSWCVIDVWNSEEALNDFAANVIMPSFVKLGVNPPQPQVYPIHRLVNATGETV